MKDGRTNMAVENVRGSLKQQWRPRCNGCTVARNYGCVRVTTNVRHIDVLSLLSYVGRN